MKNHLPKLSSMILPAFFTLRKNKKIGKVGIQINKTFRSVQIEKHNLEKFNSYFGFRTQVPLTYLYTIAQRAQTAVMLTNKFTLPIPGMMHIENKLIKENDFNPQKNFDITVSASVEYKERGSLKPVFEVEISQQNCVVAICKSTYIIKRKSKKPKTKKQKVEPLKRTNHESVWSFIPKIGKEYANISGDKNPIHTSLIFAKLFGFKKQIMHGWYSICKIEQFVEEKFKIATSEISVNFSTPVLLPTQAKFKLKKEKNKEFYYELVNNSNTKIHLNGVIR